MCRDLLALQYRNIYQALISWVTVGHHWSVATVTLATVTLCALLANRSKNLLLTVLWTSMFFSFFFFAVLEPYLSSSYIWTSLCCRLRAQTCGLSLNMLNSRCFPASFTPLNPPGLLPQREAADDGREFIPSTCSGEWGLSLHYDVFAEKRSLCNFTIMPKITFWVWSWFVCTQHLLVGMFHKSALLTAHFLAHTFSLTLGDLWLLKKVCVCVGCEGGVGGFHVSLSLSFCR